MQLCLVVSINHDEYQRILPYMCSKHYTDTDKALVQSQEPVGGERAGKEKSGKDNSEHQISQKLFQIMSKRQAEDIQCRRGNS